jgi:glucose-1-phosphate thymidylyltransferase
VKAIVLAAGYATRLYPLTLDRPKALLDVGGRPMLDRVLERLLAIGEIDETVVVTNAKFAPQFETWSVDKRQVTVVNDGTVSEDDRLGAIGDIGFVLDLLRIDDDVVVVAGDNLFGADISDFGRVARERRAPLLAVRDVGDLAEMPKYNQVQTDESGQVTFFEEKPAAATTTLMGVALYFYPRESLELIHRYLHEGNNPDQPGRLVEWLYTRTPVYTWRVPGEWYDIGSRDTLELADAAFSNVG